LKRILMVRMGAMGDIVHTLPSAASLRQAFPAAEIDWLVEDHWAALLEGNPHVSALRRLSKKRNLAAMIQVVSELREHRYDCVIDFQGLMKSAVLAKLSGAKEIIGFATNALRERPASIAYHRHIAVRLEAHVVEQNLALARAAGASKDIMEFPLPSGAADLDGTGDFLAVSPSAGWAAKRWPAEKYAELIARVERELGWKTVVNCGPGEEPLASRMGKNVRVIQGRIPALLGMARRARVFVAGDTGPLHVAAAVGTPVVAIFGPTSPQRNGPYTAKARVVRAPGTATTYSRSADTMAIARVTVEEVFRAVIELAEAAP
jgi:heptosyltransferase-1